MIKSEGFYIPTLEELVTTLNSYLKVITDENGDDAIISVSHSNPSKDHPKYSVLIVYKKKD